MSVHRSKIIIDGKTPLEIIDIITESDFQRMIGIIANTIDTFHIFHEDSTATDIVRFMTDIDTNSVSDRLLLCVFFSTKYEGQQLLNKNDFENLLFRVRDPIPRNTNALLNSLVSQELLVRHKEKKDGLIAFYLSSKGMAYVENLVGRKE